MVWDLHSGKLHADMEYTFFLSVSVGPDNESLACTYLQVSLASKASHSYWQGTATDKATETLFYCMFQALCQYWPHQQFLKELFAIRELCLPIEITSMEFCYSKYKINYSKMSYSSCF